MRDSDLPHQVGQEEHAAAQDADQMQILVLVVAADLRTKCGNTVLKGQRVDQGFVKKFVVILHRVCPFRVSGVRKWLTWHFVVLAAAGFV